MPTQPPKPESTKSKASEPTPDSPLLAELNSEQRRAVEHGEGPLLIVAGAGTGKTRVITQRIAHLIESGRARPDEILALTFTEKAAAEMRDRVYDLLPLGQAPAQISTFHSFGQTVLESYSFELGMPPGFRVLDEQGQALLLREHLFDLPIQKLRPRGNPTAHLSALARVFSRAKDEDVSAEEYAERVEGLRRELAETEDAELRLEREYELSYQEEIAAAFAYYEERKAESYRVDFADEVFLTYRLLRDHPVVASRLRRRFRYILVDEFQDTNVVQYRLVQLLAGEAGNLTVVGDDDQSIYAFRGADLQNLLEFERDYPGTERVVLRDNYRSSQQILDAAYRLIQHNNPERLEARDGIDKRLTSTEEPGPEPAFLSTASVRDEAQAIAEYMERRRAAGVALSELAVLVPRRSLTSLIAQALGARKIPVVYEEGGGLYDRPEIQMCISLLRLVASRHQSSHVIRLLKSEIYPLPQADFERLSSEHLRTREEWWELLGRVQEGDYSAEGVRIARKLVSDVETLASGAESLSVAELLYRWFAEQTTYLEELRSWEVPEAELKAQNLSRLFRRLSEYAETAQDPGVIGWVSYFDDTRDLADERPASELDLDQEAVRIMTIHQAKGLEFDSVVVAGCVQSMFDPASGGAQLGCEFLYLHPPGEGSALREQRRLFYVAMTRARRELVLSAATYYHRGGKSTLTSFVAEALGAEAAHSRVIPESNPLKVIDQTAPAQSSDGSHRLPEPLTLTVTQIDDYLTCPRKFFWKYVMRSYEPPTHHRAYGSLIHALVEEISRAHSEGRDLPIETVLEHYDMAWQNEYYLSRAHERESYETGRETIRRFYEAEQGGTAARAIEERFSFKSAGIVVTGKYDRVEGEGAETVLVDYKTTQIASQSSADERAKNSKQLTMYALALRANTGELPREVALHYIDSGITGRSTRSERQLINMEEKIAEVARSVRAGEYPYTEAKHYCAGTPLNDCPGANRRQE